MLPCSSDYIFSNFIGVWRIVSEVPNINAQLSMPNAQNFCILHFSFCINYWLPADCPQSYLIFKEFPAYSQIYRQQVLFTVSRRTEPSSRTALIGEQPNPSHLLQREDAMHFCPLLLRE